MQPDPRFEALFNGLNQNPAKPAGLLQKIGAIIATVVIFGLALTFSVMFFAVVVAAGVVIWGFVWWKTRELRRVMREAQARAHEGAQAARPQDGGLVIEGEVILEVDDEQGPRRGA